MYQNIQHILCLVIITGMMFFQPLHAFAEYEDTSPMAEVMLELYKNNDQNISLGAMLLSVGMSHRTKLVRYIRDSLSENDTPLEKSIKYYVIYNFEPDPKEKEDFIEAFPNTREDFWTLIRFECSVIQCPHSKMLTDLMNIATFEASYLIQEDIEIRNLAKRKVDLITPFADGWVAQDIDTFMNHPEIGY